MDAPNHRGENHGQASIQATPDAVNLDERLLSISSHTQGQEKQTADNDQVTCQESLFERLPAGLHPTGSGCRRGYVQPVPGRCAEGEIIPKAG